MVLGLFARNKTLENRENPLPILVNAIEIGTKCALKILRLYPFVDNHARNVDVLAKRVKRMPPQEQAIEKSRLALGG